MYVAVATAKSAASLSGFARQCFAAWLRRLVTTRPAQSLLDVELFAADRRIDEIRAVGGATREIFSDNHQKPEIGRPHPVGVSGRLRWLAAHYGPKYRSGMSAR